MHFFWWTTIAMGVAGSLLAGCGSKFGELEVELVGDELSARVLEASTTTIRLSNSGSGSLTLLRVTYEEVPALDAGPQFFVDPYVRDAELEPGDEILLTVTFVPVVPDEAHVELQISASAGNQSVTVRGVGVNNPPSVVIDETMSDTACEGVPFLFEGMVDDVEDSGATTLSARLEDSLEGVLAEGLVGEDGLFSIDIVLWVPGGHVLVLSAEDSFGESSSASFELTVIQYDSAALECAGSEDTEWVE